MQETERTLTLDSLVGVDIETPSLRIHATKPGTDDMTVELRIDGEWRKLHNVTALHFEADVSNLSKITLTLVDFYVDTPTGIIDNDNIAYAPTGQLMETETVAKSTISE